MQTKGKTVTVLVQPEIISADKARKRANGWLAMNIGHLLRANNPELILTPAFQLHWQVGIMLTSVEGKILGQVGLLELDIVTGKILSDINLYNDIISQVNAINKLVII